MGLFAPWRRSPGEDGRDEPIVIDGGRRRRSTTWRERGFEGDGSDPEPDDRLLEFSVSVWLIPACHPRAESGEGRHNPDSASSNC